MVYVYDYHQLNIKTLVIYAIKLSLTVHRNHGNVHNIIKLLPKLDLNTSSNKCKQTFITFVNENENPRF